MGDMQRSKLVAGDRYEMRLYIPDGKWKCKSMKATCTNGAEISLRSVKQLNENVFAAEMTSRTSQDVNWEFRFQRSCSSNA